MTLSAGDNSALITVTDLAGNIATTTITIQRDAIPPKRKQRGQPLKIENGVVCYP